MKDQAKVMLAELDLDDSLAVKILAAMESKGYVTRRKMEYTILSVK